MDPFIPLNLSFSQQTTCKVQSDKTAGKPVNVFEIFHNIFSFLILISEKFFVKEMFSKNNWKALFSSGHFFEV